MVRGPLGIRCGRMSITPRSEGEHLNRGYRGALHKRGNIEWDTEACFNTSFVFFFRRCYWKPSLGENEVWHCGRYCDVSSSPRGDTS